MTKFSTIIVVEHNMDFVRRISRWVTVMHEGQVFAEGPMSKSRQISVCGKFIW